MPVGRKSIAALSLLLCAQLALCIQHRPSLANHHPSYQGGRVARQDHDHHHGEDGSYDHADDGAGWDIRLSVPGEPDRDYPRLNEIPRTSFSCENRRQGYYADTQARCQVFKVCTNTASSGFFSFLCPNGTLFNQEYLVCDWWMNVKCVDTERYLNTNDAVIIKSGERMVADIKTMIMYPMNNPYTDYFPQMKTTLQTYNPPRDMISAIQNGLNGNDVSGLYKLPGPPFGSAVSSGFTKAGLLAKNNVKYSDDTHGNLKKIEDQTRAGNSFSSQNVGGLTETDRNTQAIKITKQQYTYPSQYDKEITLTIPKAQLPSPFVVRLPINVPAIDTGNRIVSNTLSKNSELEHETNNYNSTFIQSHINIPKSVPIIVLFLQPPRESPPKSYNGNSFQNNFLNHRANYQDSSKDSSSIIENKNNSYNHQHDSLKRFNQNNTLTNISTKTQYFNNDQSSLIKNHRVDNSFRKHELNRENSKYSVNDGNSGNTFVKKEITTTVVSNPNYNSNLQTSNIESFDNNKVTNNGGENNNGLVTLLSAHVIPAGDVNRQKVFKICIPKNILSYLMHVHNSTKTAIEGNFQNELSALTNIKNNTNTTIHIESQPLLRKIMEKFLYKNYSSNQQVPILTGEEFYTKQKLQNSQLQNSQLQNSQQDSRVLNSNYELSKYSNSSFGQHQISQNISKISGPGYTSSITDTKTFVVPASNIYQQKEYFHNSQIRNDEVNNNAQNNFRNEKSQQDVFTNNQRITEQNFAVDDQIRKENNQQFTKQQPNVSGYNQNQVYYQQNQNSKPIYTSQYNAQNNNFASNFEENGKNEFLQYNQYKNSSLLNHHEIIHSEKIINNAENPSGNTQQISNIQDNSNRNQKSNDIRFSHLNDNQHNTNSYYQQNQAAVSQNQNQNYQSQKIIQHQSSRKEEYPSYQISNQEMSAQLNIQKQNMYPHQNYNVQMGYSVPDDQMSQTQPGLQSHYSAVNSYTNSYSQDKNNYENGMLAYGRRDDTRNQNSQIVQNNFVDSRLSSNYAYDNRKNGEFPQVNQFNNNYQDTRVHTSQAANGQTNHFSEKLIQQPQQLNFPNGGQQLVITGEGQNVNNNANRIADIRNQESQQDDNYYTTVEVVPALGFALNSDQERQTYYSALMNQYKNNNQYAVTQKQQVVSYPTMSENNALSNMRNSQDSVYRATNYQNIASVNQFSPERRIIHGQIIAHTMPQVVNSMKQQSLPIEDFGYPRERPTISFTY